MIAVVLALLQRSPLTPVFLSLPSVIARGKTAASRTPIQPESPTAGIVAKSGERGIFKPADLMHVRTGAHKAQCLSDLSHRDSVGWHQFGPQKAVSLRSVRKSLARHPVVHDPAETASTIRLKRRPPSR